MKILSISVFFATAVFFFPYAVSSDEIISDSIELGTKFYIRSDQDIAPVDYLRLGAELDGRFEPSESWELGLTVDAAYDEVETEEVWIRYKAPGRIRYQLGMFENEILLEDQFPVKDLPFAGDSLTRRHMDSAGWYSSRNLGVKAYRNYKEDTLPVSGFSHLMLQPAGREFQADLGLYYPFTGDEKSWLGLSAAWYPYWVHNSWVGSSSSYAQDNNWIFQAAVADMGGKTIIYRGSLTVGSNLVDPVGITHLPGNGDPSWFGSADCMVAFPRGDKEFSWLPGLELSFLSYDLDNSKSWRTDLRTGHRLAWDKTFYLHLEAGLGIVTNYGSDDQGVQELQTSLEELWGVSFQVRL